MKLLALLNKNTKIAHILRVLPERTYKNKKFLAILVGGTFFWVVGGYYFQKNFDVGINSTPSLPYRILVMKKHFNQDEIKKGKVIQFKLGFDSPYEHYKKDTYFAKRIVCGPGDVYRNDGLNYFCNEQYLNLALTEDSKGKPIPKYFHYNGVIPEGHYVVAGSHSHSYDSRYWGFVKKEAITGVEKWLF